MLGVGDGRRVGCWRRRGGGLGGGRRGRRGGAPRFEAGAIAVPVTAGETVASASVPQAVPGSMVLATIQGSSLGTGISHATVSGAGSIEVHLDGPAASNGVIAVFVMN